MHYYKLNIADWNLGTAHLTLEEEAVYFRLVNHYYDSEKPIPTDKHIIRRLRLLAYEEVIERVLDEFFILTDDGWVHTKCEQLLKDYRKNSKKNKLNGAKGGRPIKTKGLSITQSEPNGLPVVTQTKPKHSPNQEPLTTNQREQDNFIALSIFNGIQSLNPKAKEPDFSKWENIIRLMREQDKRTHEEIESLFHWANKDDFWHQNILSPEKLRKQWDTLVIQRKAQMNGGRNLKLPALDEALSSFAEKNNLPKANAGETFPQYRGRLNSELAKRIN